LLTLAIVSIALSLWAKRKTRENDVVTQAARETTSP
jgi:hypothetical protein